WPLADLPGQRTGVVQRLALLAQPVHQPEGQTFGGRDLRAQDHELERLGAADEPRHALSAAKAGNDAEVRLGLAHARRLLEQTQVARHRDLTAASQRVAVHRGDDGLAEALDLPEHAVAEADEGVDALAREGRAQIGSRAEDLVAAAGDDEAAHTVVVLEAAH